MALAACSLAGGALPPTPGSLSPVQPCLARVSRSEASGPPPCCSYGLSSSSGSLGSPPIRLGDHLGAGLGSTGLGVRGQSSACLQMLFSHPHLCFGTSSPGGSAPLSPLRFSVLRSDLCVACLSVCSLLFAAHVHVLLKLFILCFSEHSFHFQKTGLET